MTEEAIRAKIRERLITGTLPRAMVVRRTVKGEVIEHPDIQVGIVRGYPCAGCDGPDPDITYRKGDVGLRFHTECARIWEEERTKVQAE